MRSCVRGGNFFARAVEARLKRRRGKQKKNERGGKKKKRVAKAELLKRTFLSHSLNSENVVDKSYLNSEV
jgi:hypothetical protein